jgi:hypothetical protein
MRFMRARLMTMPVLYRQRPAAQAGPRSARDEGNFFAMADADDPLHLFRRHGQQHGQRRDAKVGQPVALVGAQLGVFGDQTPTKDGAELAEDAGF